MLDSMKTNNVKIFHHNRLEYEITVFSTCPSLSKQTRHYT